MKVFFRCQQKNCYTQNEDFITCKTTDFFNHDLYSKKNWFLPTGTLWVKLELNLNKGRQMKPDNDKCTCTCTATVNWSL